MTELSRNGETGIGGVMTEAETTAVIDAYEAVEAAAKALHEQNQLATEEWGDIDDDHRESLLTEAQNAITAYKAALAEQGGDAKRLREAAELAVTACMDLLPLEGSWQSGYRVPAREGTPTDAQVEIVQRGIEGICNFNGMEYDSDDVAAKASGMLTAAFTVQGDGPTPHEAIVPITAQSADDKKPKPPSTPQPPEEQPEDRIVAVLEQYVERNEEAEAVNLALTPPRSSGSPVGGQEARREWWVERHLGGHDVNIIHGTPLEVGEGIRLVSAEAMEQLRKALTEIAQPAGACVRGRGACRGGVKAQEIARAALSATSPSGEPQ